MTRPRWYADRAALCFEIAAGEARHRISWTRGRLRLHDHDLAAEEVLRALGADGCDCMLVLEAFRDRGQRGGTPPWRSVHISAGLRGPAAGQAIPPGAGLHALSQAPAAALANFMRTPQFATLPPDQRGQIEVSMRHQRLLRVLPDAALELLGDCQAIRRDRRAPPEPAAAPTLSGERRLQQAVAPAVEEAIRASRRDLRTYASMTVECWSRLPEEEELLNGHLDSGGGFVAISLPLSWLNRVWARGMAVADGHFVLEAKEPAPARRLSGRAIRWERRLGEGSIPVPTDCRLYRSDAGEWSLAWDS